MSEIAKPRKNWKTQKLKLLVNTGDIMRRIAIIGLLVGGLGVAAQAQTIQLGTGLDASGNLLSSGSFEQNYTIGGNASAAIVDYVTGSWIANQPKGQWITPANAQGAVTDPQDGITTYTRTIDGTGTINVEFASDNPGELLINGTAVAQGLGWPTTDDSDYSRFISYSGSLDQAVNTIEFEVYNSFGPTGLIVDGTATINNANTVPDGGFTLTMLGAALTGWGSFAGSSELRNGKPLVFPGRVCLHDSPDSQAPSAKIRWGLPVSSLLPQAKVMRQ